MSTTDTRATAPPALPPWLALSTALLPDLSSLRRLVPKHGYDEELELEFEDRHPLPGLPLGADDRDEAGEKAYRRSYFQQLFRLQGEVVRLQDRVVATRENVVILFEARDAAEKGGAIERIAQWLNPPEHYSRQAVPAEMLVSEIY